MRHKTNNLRWRHNIDFSRKKIPAVDLSHSADMLSLGKIKSFVFARLSLAHTRIQCEASRAKTKLLFSLDSTWLPSEKGLTLQWHIRRDQTSLICRRSVPPWGTVRYLSYPNSAQNPVICLVVMVIKSVRRPIVWPARRMIRASLRGKRSRTSEELFSHSGRAKIGARAKRSTERHGNACHAG